MFISIEQIFICFLLYLLYLYIFLFLFIEYRTPNIAIIDPQTGIVQRWVNNYIINCYYIFFQFILFYWFIDLLIYLYIYYCFSFELDYCISITTTSY
jgi:hypothetical protein